LHELCNAYSTKIVLLWIKKYKEGFKVLKDHKKNNTKEKLQCDKIKKIIWLIAANSFSAATTDLRNSNFPIFENTVRHRLKTAKIHLYTPVKIIVFTKAYRNKKN